MPISQSALPPQPIHVEKYDYPRRGEQESPFSEQTKDRCADTQCYKTKSEGKNGKPPVNVVNPIPFAPFIQQSPNSVCQRQDVVLERKNGSNDTQPHTVNFSSETSGSSKIARSEVTMGLRSEAARIAKETRFCLECILFLAKEGDNSDLLREVMEAIEEHRDRVLNLMPGIKLDDFIAERIQTEIGLKVKESSILKSLLERIEQNEERIDTIRSTSSPMAGFIDKRIKPTASVRESIKQALMRLVEIPDEIREITPDISTTYGKSRKEKEKRLLNLQRELKAQEEFLTANMTMAETPRKFKNKTKKGGHERQVATKRLKRIEKLYKRATKGALSKEKVSRLAQHIIEIGLLTETDWLSMNSNTQLIEIQNSLSRILMRERSSMLEQLSMKHQTKRRKDTGTDDEYRKDIDRFEVELPDFEPDFTVPEAKTDPYEEDLGQEGECSPSDDTSDDKEEWARFMPEYKFDNFYKLEADPALEEWLNQRGYETAADEDSTADEAAGWFKPAEVISSMPSSHQSR